VASTLSTAVENLQNLSELAPILKNLGADHVPKGVKKEHYPVVMGAVIKTLKDNLGENFTPVVEKAWEVTLRIV
jgi:nitric oxide dioxygenase